MKDLGDGVYNITLDKTFAGFDGIPTNLPADVKFNWAGVELAANHYRTEMEKLQAENTKLKGPSPPPPSSART